VPNTAIKKAIFSKSQLPPINSDLGKYVVRYRIVSEDRNKFSHWSPQYLVSPVPLKESAKVDAMAITKSPGFLTVSWVTEPDPTPTSYDVYVAWGTEPQSVGVPEYFATVSGNLVTIPIPAARVSAQIWVQRMSIPRARLDSMTIASTDGVISTT
jgi:hypothetical protein